MCIQLFKDRGSEKSGDDFIVNFINRDYELGYIFRYNAKQNFLGEIQNEQT